LLRLACLIGLVIAIMASVANAQMPAPDSYGENECQKAALDYQKEFGGSLIWIQPIDEWGNPILGKYNAHVINKVYDPILKELIYVDYVAGMKASANFTIESFNGMPAKAYDLSKERPEWGLIWHY